MNKLLLFLCCICVPWIARGQAAYEWLYWFDMNHASLVSGQSTGDRFAITTNVDGLSEGFHTIHVQVADTAGKYSPPLGQLFYYTSGRAVKQLHYWFDNEVSLTQSIPAPLDNLSIDVSGVEPGLHFIYCQAEDAAGMRSDVICRAFYRQAIKSALKWTYWFDEDEESRVTVPFPGEMTMIDVSDLQEGFHVLHSQMFDAVASDITTTMFIKVPQTEGVDDMTCICIVDGKLVAKEILPTSGGILKWDMDVDNMEVGIHKAMFQVITPSGAASSIAERFFVRAITNKELGSMKCVYTIDNFQTYHQAGTLSDGLFHFDLDVADIENGLHRLAYTLISETGITLPQQTAFFWKTPLGGEGIIQYDYWVNNNNVQKHSVQLDKRTNPFTLITLLPVETQPIRSSNFQFAIKNGKPLIYARNDFHIQFFDTNGRMVEETKEYVDEQVSAAVEPVGELQATQTFDKVAENDIRWYTMQVAPGDTAAFKLSQAGTVQVFAPSGKEVFKTSESASVNWGGIHTWEDGTYYLAVHDVTGSKEDMTLKYMHMDKYDVVDWDVHTVGNGGCSTITFKGNGFRDLYAVDLVIAPGDTIRSVDVSHDSDAETAVTFDFTGAALGDYNAVFHFTEEDKHIAKVVTVEEAIDIELATDVSFPSSFLRGTSTTYTIKITNKGNMTAYDVPIYSYLMNKDQEDGISHIKFDGLGLANLLDIIGIDSLSLEDRMELQEVVEEIGDEHYFQIIRAENEETPGDSIWVRCGYFFTNIAPFETKTLRLIVTANETVWAYISVPSDWSVFSKTKDNIASRALLVSQKANLKDGFCCYHEKIECYLDMTSLVADFVEIGALVAAPFTKGATLPVAEKAKWIGCATSSLSSLSSISATLFCDADKSFIEKLKEQGAMNTLSVLATVLSCRPEELKAIKIGAKFIKEMLKNWKSLVKGGIKWGDNGAGFFQCRSNPQKVPGCPPDPPHGGTSNMRNSCEPNDIIGYLAESGSNAIKEGHTNVFYTIQFENDTVFATAPAHDIYLTDTLDVNLFDLSTYQPTRITIGEKSMELTGERNFISTLDMRPEINAIAQVEGTIDDKTGIVRWHISSLDPMTMEPTDDVMQGVLPVNLDGSGLGEASFNISLKPNLPDGTIIPNRSGNVFDYNETVLTPTWTNIVDAVAPSSVIDNSWMVNDSTLRITADGFDARSGVWKYEWYVQAGENAPWWKEGETESASFDYHIYEGIDYGFCVLAVDSAGNVEQKVIQRERGFKTYGPDYEDTIEETPADTPDKAQDIYDLSGRKHDEPQENQINIIDKKKVLFRRKGK